MTDFHSDAFKKIADAAAAVSEDIIPVPFIMVGATDSRNFRAISNGVVNFCPGAGATFVVTLPPAALAPPAPGEVAAVPGPKARRARVLAVDDEPQVLRSIQRALGAHEVVVADCGRDALSRLATDQAFDVILCDLMMGDMTGMDLHAALHRRSPDLAARIVFMTGGVFTDGARDFLAGVPNACIEKPFDLVALRAMVQKLGTAPVSG